MHSRRPKVEVTVIRDQNEVEELCARCRSEGRLAFDTEFVMEDRYESELCLLQIATQGSVVVIDPFLDLDLSQVWALVADEGIETIVHAGQEDLAIASRCAGRVPRRVFDTQIAAGLVGMDYPISLQRLVQAALHIRLHKSKTLTDWRKRPLTDSQIQYAAEDVMCLLEVHSQLLDKLEGLDRIEWAREEFERFEEPTTYRRAEEDKLMRLKGTGTMNGAELVVVRELLAWREEAAKQLNRPARAVLKDHLLVEIARHGLSGPAEISDLRGLNLGNRHVRAVGEVVAKAGEIPSSEWPTPKPRQVESPRDAALTALATAVIRSYCIEYTLAYGLVATQKSIRELIQHCTLKGSGDATGIELLTGWRGRSVGAMLADVLAGRRTVCVEKLNGAPYVHVKQED